jgi:uncharacterized Zn finger protein
MGSFDSVVARCPNCNEEVEFQSKAGRCNMRIFNPGEVPYGIAADLDRTEERCRSCGYVVKLRTPMANTVRMIVE